MPAYNMSLQLLDDIYVAKIAEKDHAATIRSTIPELEPTFRQLLLQWEEALERTTRMTSQLRSDLLNAQRSTATELWSNDLSQLVNFALQQSREFNRQLHQMQAHSAAIQLLPEVDIMQLRQEQQNDEDNDPLDIPQPADSTVRPSSKRQAAVPIGGHQLPPLPYAYNALEPWIDERTMRIHHDKHHQSYVDGLNKAEKKLAEARQSGNFDLVKHWERELAFNGAGHYLHTLFWNVMMPKGGGKPDGELLAEIKRSFGSYEAFKKQYTEAAKNVEGGGWAILVWSPRSHRLEILTAEKHQNLSQWDVVPLLPLDVWEHAYYLKHQNDRAAYINDWWNLVNWPYVAGRFDEARKLEWIPY